jgi:hypothetical protein
MDLQASSWLGRAVLLVRSGVQCWQAVSVRCGKPYAEVYMMGIGPGEGRWEAGSLRRKGLQDKARTGVVPIRALIACANRAFSASTGRVPLS